MTLFWITAAGMVILALLFVVPPLLRYRPVEEASNDEVNLAVIKQQLLELEADLEAGDLEQEQYDAARHDLEKELLADVGSGTDAAPASEPKPGRWAMAAISVLIPAIAFPVYYYLGSPSLIPQVENMPAPTAAASSPPEAHEAPGQSMTSMVELVEKLAQRLENEPNNAEGWAMLGRSYIALNRFSDALNAYEKAYSLTPSNPDLLLGYATTLARVNGNSFTGRPAELIDEAMQLAPQDPNVMWLKGITHLQDGEPAQAIQLWEKLLAMLEPGSEEAQSVADYIREAKSQLPPGSAMAATAPAAAPTAQPTAAGGKSIRVTVDLDPALRDKVQDSDRVFIFARALTGPPMPLAAARHQVSDLPITVVLDDSMAMMPQLTLSQFPQVVVGARVSKSGDAIPKSGDLQGEVSPVTPGQEETVSLVVNSVVP